MGGIDLRDAALSADAVRAALRLAPHPEGGWYRETWRDAPAADSSARGAGTAILFMLAAGEASAWHRVDAAELWLWHAGAPLTLFVADQRVCLGPDLGAGEVPQGIVPAGVWQAARPAGAWSLVSCVVAPAFRFDGFELAPPGMFPAP